jgi:hypothetical protein
MDLARAVRTGLAGAAAMGATTALEMRLRGRPPSPVPARMLARLPVLGPLAERHPDFVSWAGLPASALLMGAARERLPGPAAFFALVWSPDLVLAPAARAAPPPWRWTPAELALSAAHHAAFALAGEAAYRCSGSDCSS